MWIDKNSIYYFFKEKKNTIDVVYIGPSNVYEYFNNTLAFSEYGFTVGLLSTYGIPFSSYYYLLKESRNYQTPELYVIDLMSITYIYKPNDSSIRRVTDSMPNSLNRIDAINYLLEETGIEEYTLSYYFSFIKYHDRWDDLSSSNFKNITYYKGYFFTTMSLEREEQTKKDWISSTASLGDSEELLIKLLEYMKEEDLNVLFVIPIRIYEEFEMERLNEAIEIIEEYDYEVINFNLLDEEIGIDYATDFYNSGHLNVYGATKYTLYFSKYLVENYDLPDHREDSAYSSWMEVYAKFTLDYYWISGEEFAELL